MGGRDDLGLVFHSRQAIDKRGNRVENVVMDIHAGAELLVPYPDYRVKVVHRANPSVRNRKT